MDIPRKIYKCQAVQQRNTQKMVKNQNDLQYLLDWQRP